jgi:hypothetical protein
MTLPSTYDLTKPPVGFKNLKGSVRRETDKAILFISHSANGIAYTIPKTEWFPLSQVKSIIRSLSELEPNEDVLVVSNWIFDTKGM